jgi:hypothetical protein
VNIIPCLLWNIMRITSDYICGLTDGEGCFTFCKSNGFKIPTFMISMHYRDEKLLTEVRDFMGLKNTIYILKPYLSDGYDRKSTARLMVRDFLSLRDKVIPMFHKRLIGYKATQFENWIKLIGSDPLVPERYKLLHRLYGYGYFDKNVSQQTPSIK